MNKVSYTSEFKEINDFWQYVRAICIICVILIHCKNGIEYKNSQSISWNYDYWFLIRQLINFPVATFIFLSGYFTNVETAVNSKLLYIFEKLKRLILPFIVWSSFYTFVNIISSEGKVDILKTFGELLLGLAQGHLYYIIVLAQLILLTPYLVRIIKANKFNLIVLMITPVYLLFLYMYTLLFKDLMPNYQTYFPAWFIFYYFGLLMNVKGDFNRQKIFNTKILVILIVGAFLISVFEGYLLFNFGFPIGFSISQIKVSSFIYTFLIINLFIQIEPFIKTTKRSLLKYIGDNSFGIYFVHILWIMISDKILVNFSVINDILPAYQIIQFIFVLFLSCLSIYFSKRIFGEKLSRLFLGF